MNIYRLHLKTDAEDRSALIEDCLQNDRIAIGWSYIYEKNSINDIDEFWNAIKADLGKIPSAIDIFDRIEINDLIWIRDLEGNYYLCRAKEKAKEYCDKEKDIGCIVKVEKYLIGTNVPGKIVRCFYPSRAIQRMTDDKIGIFSQELFNFKSGRNVYKPEKKQYDFFSMIHPLDLEELVLCYLQVKYNYYLSKNSVAMNDTTIKIEGELFSRDVSNPISVVVQVKSGGSSVSVLDYVPYVKQGKKVFLFFENENYSDNIQGITNIMKTELLDFIKLYKSILPSAIRDWAVICGL